MASHVTTKYAVDTPTIPDRLYFKIGDVAKICSVETYVLRFWETQFPQLKPNKSGKGQRLYRRRDVEMALDIKRLVHDERYTISGARHALDAMQSKGKAVPALTAVPANGALAAIKSLSDKEKAAILRVKSELREIASLLASAPGTRRERPRIVRARTESDRLFPM